MTEMKSTPGPWRAVKNKHGPIDILDGRERDVVTVYGGGVESESREANARLIAAAPDLLSALTGMVSMYAELVESGDAGFWDAEKVPEVIAARNAISKAEGRQ